MHVDITDQKRISNAADHVTTAFGKLDILVDNADFMTEDSLTADSDPEAYWKTWDVNYCGNYLVTRAFLPLLLRTDEGLKTIMCLNSVAGASACASTKLALLRFIEFIMLEYAPEGVLTGKNAKGCADGTVFSRPTVQYKTELSKLERVESVEPDSAANDETRQKAQPQGPTYRPLYRTPVHSQCF